MTQTIKERLELLKQWEDPDVKGMKYTQYKTDPVLTPLIFNEGVDACLPLLEEEYRQGFDDGMKHREFLICPCGCPMRIDAKDYQEKHSGEALTPPTK